MVKKECSGARHLHIIPIRILRIVCRLLLTKIVVHDVVLCTSLHHHLSTINHAFSLLYRCLPCCDASRWNDFYVSLLSITQKVSPIFNTALENCPGSPSYFEFCTYKSLTPALPCVLMMMCFMVLYRQ